ncbi:ABC transporter ATP-binding protein [Patescibacteria group bacterium]
MKKKPFRGIKIIIQYLKPYKKRVYFIIFIAILSSAISAFIPYIYGRLVDVSIMDNSSLLVIGKILLLWLFLSLIDGWFSRISVFNGYELSVEASNDLTVEITSHVLDLPLSFHKNEKIGKVMQKVDNGASYMEMIIDNAIFGICPSFLTVIISLIIMAFVEWHLSLILFSILALYFLTSVWKTDPIIQYEKKINKTSEQVFGDLYDAVGNIQIVKSCVREKLEKKKLDKNFRHKLTDKIKSSLNSWRSLNVWQDSIFSLGFVFIFTSAVLFLRSGTITAGQLVMFIGYTSLAFQPFGMIAGYYRQIRKGLTAIERANDLLKEKPEPYKGRKIELKNVRGAIEFQNVSFQYDKGKGILKDINLKTKVGQMIALVGESGVGKSTLVDLISGYYKPNKGKILIDGQDISKATLKSIRKNIAIVPQEISLFNDTIINNLRYGNLKATEQEVISATKVANANKFIQKFPKKYKQMVGERGIKLSTGQKQRIAIARAILRNPKILILDEATASLDSATEKLVQDALEHLIKGRTTFVIAHRLSTIQKADQIFVLKDGKIIEEGDHKELVEKGGVYKELCKLQATVIK